MNKKIGKKKKLEQSILSTFYENFFQIYVEIPWTFFGLDKPQSKLSYR